MESPKSPLDKVVAKRVRGKWTVIVHRLAADAYQAHVFMKGKERFVVDGESVVASIKYALKIADEMNVLYKD